MAGRISRQKLARYVADQLIRTSSQSVLKELAAFLIDTKRTREVELVVRDIEYALMERGVVVADVVTAYPLTNELKSHIKTLAGGDELILRETLDKSVLGGMRVTFPDKRLDATLRRKIQAIKA